MVKSQVEIISRALEYLGLVTPIQYVEVDHQCFGSSAGAHMRHIIDHYDAIRVGLACGVIDYDVRCRGGIVETCLEAAIKQLKQIAQWLSTLEPALMEQSITLSTQVCISRKQVAKVQTSVGRELVFAGSHAIHHFAMIGQIARRQQILLPHDFALAPATASAKREQLN